MDPGFRNEIFAPVLGDKKTGDQRFSVHDGIEVDDTKNACKLTFSTETVKTTYDY